MVDMQRALLDELMGRDRDGERKNLKLTIFDSQVCRSYLCGLCPRELFVNTKVDVGGCDKVHDPVLKKSYEEEKRKRTGFTFDEDLEIDLLKVVSECDRQINRNKYKLEDSNGPTTISCDEDEEVQKITEEIKQYVKSAEELGEEGKVDESQEMMKKAEDLRAKKIELQAKAAASKVPQEIANVVQGGSTTIQKLRVCEVCGAYLSILDSDRRLADHFGGKLHLGYAKIREKLDDLKSKSKRRRHESPGGERDDGKRRRLSPQVSKEPERDRERDRERERERERDRERERERERERDRHRERDRGERDRDRSDRHKERDRSEKDRDRSEKERDRSEKERDRSEKERDRSEKDRVVLK